MEGQHMGGWNMFELLQPDGKKDYHVTPIDDLREHPLEPTCWCNPEVETDGQHTAYTHNSADHREDYETGARKPS